MDDLNEMMENDKRYAELLGEEDFDPLDAGEILEEMYGCDENYTLEDAIDDNWNNDLR